MIPDDTAGRPLTPGEQAAVADLERRLLLSTPVPGHARPRPMRFGAVRRAGARSVAMLLVLLGVAVALVALAVVVGGGVLGIAAVIASVAGTALAWPVLPARFGGPMRPSRRPLRTRGRLPGRS